MTIHIRAAGCPSSAALVGMTASILATLLIVTPAAPGYVVRHPV